MTAVWLNRQGRRAFNRIQTHSFSREQQSPADWFCTLMLAFKHCTIADQVRLRACKLPQVLTLTSLVNTHLTVSHCLRAKQTNLKDLSFPVWIWHQMGFSLQPYRLTLHNIMKEAALKAVTISHLCTSAGDCVVCALGHVIKHDYGFFQAHQDESLMISCIHGYKAFR